MLKFKYGVSYSCFVYDEDEGEYISPFGGSCDDDSTIEAVSNELCSVTDVNRYSQHIAAVVDFNHLLVGSEVQLIGGEVVAVITSGGDVVAVVFSDPALPNVW